MRGRVYAVMHVVENAMPLVRLDLGDVLVDRVGVRTISHLGSALLLAAGIFGLRLLGGYTFDGPGHQHRPRGLLGRHARVTFCQNGIGPAPNMK